jgi:uncharacterized protein (DUF488 family)
MAADVFTIGHSTHTLDELVALLRRHAVECVADVRAYPGSRRLPHFNRESLRVELPEHGIAYQHMPALGGRRRPQPGSPNTGWENESFRAYADHLDSAEFAEGLAALRALAEERPTAIMCAEALWWRCHRRLISDALIVRGHCVLHIAADGGLTEHQVTEFAQVDGERLSYPGEQPTLFSD